MKIERILCIMVGLLFMSCSLNPVMEEKPRKDVSEIPIKVELKKQEERSAFKMIRGMPIVTIKINNQGPYNF
ncbi:hypothetical protein KKA14_20425, partial [bacterium]|nr:hypothetical protein [bacterium]